MRSFHAVSETFVPASGHVIDSGAHTITRDLIVLGVLNGLVVALSHVIFSFYAFLGPLTFIMHFYHQCMENLLIASVYLLMPLTAPRRLPFTVNAVVWGAMGLMQGWWPLIVVSVPAALIADAVVRRAVPANKNGWVLISFAFYTAMLSAATYWPYLLLKQSTMMKRMMAMDPGVAEIVDKFTWTFFSSQTIAAFVTALIGGHFALGLLTRHFALESGPPC